MGLMYAHFEMRIVESVAASDTNRHTKQGERAQESVLCSAYLFVLVAAIGLTVRSSK